MIADIDLAPRSSRGTVEYSTDVYILRPVDRAKGNHRIFFEINNRGNNFSFGLLNNASAAVVNDPTTAVEVGNGFLMRQGYTIVLSGWDAGVAPGGGRQTISVPVARNRDGSSIVGPALEELVIDNPTTMTGILTYAAATLDKFQASLSVRARYSDPPTSIPATGWEYVNATTIRLLPAGTPFSQGTLYEFTYLARDPIVAGLGFAATRDLAAYLRRPVRNRAGNPAALAEGANYVYSFCFSQPCRFLHDFIAMGFNEDERGERVFDGMLNWLGGGSGGFFNYRFAQPGRTHRQHIGRWYPERQFPFANQILFDPITGKTGGRLSRCRASDTCPRIFEANSANEYWVKAGSLLHTDTLGNDLRDPRNVRFYLFSSLPHSAGIGPTGPGICQQPRNPVVANPGLRALLVALDEWVSTGEKPPASRVPLRANGTLVPSLPQDDAGRDRHHHGRHHQDAVGFPRIPGVIYNGLMTTGDLFDYGPFFDDGLLTILPPVLVGSPYPALVPKTDSDGNDVAGVRLPEVAVPLATFTGWGLRAPAFGGDDLCDAAGQKIDFYQTRNERLAAGDPRPSIEERYPTHWTYVKEVTRAAKRLGRERFLLDEDVQGYIDQAKASGIGK